MCGKKAGRGLGRKLCVIGVALAVACGTDESSPDPVGADAQVDVESDADAEAEVEAELDADGEIADAQVDDAEVGVDAELDDDHDEVVAEVVAEVVEPEPPGLMLTVAQVPSAMNGSRPTITPSGPLDYHLRVNRAGFELDAFATGTVAWETLAVTCLDDEGAAIAMPSVEARTASWRVFGFGVTGAGDVVAPVAERMVCSGSISGPRGTAEASFVFETADLVSELDPFPQTDVWVVQLVRDTFRMEAVELPDGTVDLRSTWVAAGDGVDDFDAPFFELGLMSRTSIEAARTVREHLIRRVKEYTWAIYGLAEDGRPVSGGVDIAILFEGDEGTPDPADFDEGGFSRIALTGDGDADDQVAGTFGRALIDWNNQGQEDDARFGLGVWPTALARGILRNSLGVLLLEPYRPSQGGVAFGDHPDDAGFLGRDDVVVGELSAEAQQRYAIYGLVIDLGGMAMASILAHELGHSLGLVPFGAPPTGLFAGVRTDFVVTLADDAHIDTEGLNVMQTGGNLNISEAIGGERPAFEPLSWAYLRRQIVVGPAR